MKGNVVKRTLVNSGRGLSSSCALLLAIGCASATTGVKWEPRADAPPLPSRGGGCYVEVYELGKEPARPYLVVGVLTLKLDAEDLRTGGGQGITDRFKKAACEYGVFMVKDIKAYPDTTRGGAEYEAKAAVFLDDKGQPILVRSGNDAVAGPSDAGAKSAPPETTTSDDDGEGDPLP